MKKIKKKIKPTRKLKRKISKSSKKNPHPDISQENLRVFRDHHFKVIAILDNQFVTAGYLKGSSVYKDKDFFWDLKEDPDLIFNYTHPNWRDRKMGDAVYGGLDEIIAAEYSHGYDYEQNFEKKPSDSNGITDIIEYVFRLSDIEQIESNIDFEKSIDQEIINTYLYNV